MNRPAWVTNESEWFRDCAEVVHTCRAYLSGELGLIEAARSLVRSAHRLREDHNPDFTFFIGVDSETDHLSVGPWREGWAADSLAKKDKEVEAAEEFRRPAARGAAQSLLHKFHSPFEKP